MAISLFLHGGDDPGSRGVKSSESVLGMLTGPTLSREVRIHAFILVTVTKSIGMAQIAQNESETHS